MKDDDVMVFFLFLCSMSTVKDSPVKLVPESAEVEMDLFSSSDSLTPVSTTAVAVSLGVVPKFRL